MDHMKRLELIMLGNTFDGKDRIHVLGFLARFVREADTLKMTEAKAHFAVP